MDLVPLTVDDAEAVHALVRRWETHWRVPLVTPLSEIVHDLTAPGFEPALDTRGVWMEGRLVAFGAVSHRASGVRLERAMAPGRVDPDVRGNGLGRRLLAWQIERAADRLRQCDPSLPWYVRTFEWEWVTDSHHLFARMGMHPVRWFEELVRPLSELPAIEPPAGVAIEPWDAVPSEAARQVSNESFADHWGSTPRDPMSWRHMEKAEWVRRDLSFVATSEGEVVGVCLNVSFPDDATVTGRLDGWIDHLGVLASWRGRGVARALIAASLHAFWEAGYTHAAIGVDADNPSGASQLYRRLGFEPIHRTVTSELRIRPL